MYGIETLPMNTKNLADLESTQGTAIKTCLGIPKRHHHTALLEAANISSVSEMFKSKSAALFNKVFSVDTPVRDLNLHFLSRYIIRGERMKGTLLDAVVSCGIDPIILAFSKETRLLWKKKPEDGVVDSIRHLIYRENYIKPWSTEYMLTCILTIAF